MVTDARIVDSAVHKLCRQLHLCVRVAGMARGRGECFAPLDLSMEHEIRFVRVF